MNKIPDKIYLHQKGDDRCHIVDIISIDYASKKMILQVDKESYQNVFHMNNVVEIKIILGGKTYLFNSLIRFYDMINLVLIIDYPENMKEVALRKFNRHAFRVLLKLISPDKEIDAVTNDISSQGLSFYSQKNLSIGEEMMAIFAFSTDKPINIINIKIANKRVVTFMRKNMNVYGAKFFNNEPRRIASFKAAVHENFEEIKL